MKRVCGKHNLFIVCVVDLLLRIPRRIYSEIAIPAGRRLRRLRRQYRCHKAATRRPGTSIDPPDRAPAAAPRACVSNTEDHRRFRRQQRTA
jgi:hypothetical protein